MNYVTQYSPLGQVTNRMSRSAKRLAYIQTSLIILVAIIIGLLYQIILEILSIPMDVVDDPEALYNYLDSLINQHLSSLTIIMFLGFIILVLGIIYLVSFFQLSSTFIKLSNIETSVAKEAKNAGNFMRYSMLIIILSSFFGTGTSMVTYYIGLVANLVAIVLMTLGYFYIGQIFKKLRINGLYSKKEDRLIFYGQIAALSSIIPISIVAPQLYSTEPLLIAPLIVAGVLIIGGYICLSVGFYKLGNNAKLIRGSLHSSEQLIQVTTEYEKPYQPSQSAYVASKIYSEPLIDEPVNSDVASFCYNCGAKIFSSTKFCENCGANLED